MSPAEGGLTPGDPLGAPRPGPETPERPGADPPRRGPETPERPTSDHYGGGPVPPGALSGAPGRAAREAAIDLPPAAYGRRVVATLVDALIVFALAAAVLGLVIAVAGSFDDDATGVAAAILSALIAVLAITVGALVYAPAVMARTNGRTVGKMVTGIRVVRADGRRVDFLWAALREVVVKAFALGIAAALTGGLAYLVDVLWPFVDGRRRALHDIVVDSRVVRDP